MNNHRIAIIGAGNIGTCIAKGLAESGHFAMNDIILRRRNLQALEMLKNLGFSICVDNREAVSQAHIIILSVEPQQIDSVLTEIASVLIPECHVLISTVTGVTIEQIRSKIGASIPVVRAMPNTAIAIKESMTCLAADITDSEAIEIAKEIFGTVGKVMLIDEDQMSAATALVACGIAFFLRAIRAASQGGIEIGFHSEHAISMAAQTALGAAGLLLATANHPEMEIDKVTTPRGCTIAGLNQMEHEGFSSALITGITVSAEKAAKLYTNQNKQRSQ